MSSQAQPIVVTLWVPDPAQVLPFYTDLLGLQRDDHHGHMPNLKVGDISLVLMPGTPQPPKNPGREPWPIFAFAVPNYAEIEQRLTEANVPILERSPAGKPHQWFMFPDPAGNILELVNAAGPLS